MTFVTLPLTERQAQACAAAALNLNVQTWEIGAEALKFKARIEALQSLRSL